MLLPILVLASAASAIATLLPTTTNEDAVNGPLAHRNLQPRATGGKVTPSAGAVTTVNNMDGLLVDYYRQYNGNGTTAAGWPSKTAWISFEDMWQANQYYFTQSCSQFGFPNNSPTETTNIYNAIQSAAASTYVDHRFILAIIIQESSGCVRVPTTGTYCQGCISNPGLMQDHSGSGTCWSNSTGTVIVQTPCPAVEITQMIQDGTGGTAAGDGLAQCLNEAILSGTNGDVATFYRAARIYNTGSITDPQHLGKAQYGTPCYASDIANRLTGWVQYASTCKSPS